MQFAACKASVYNAVSSKTAQGHSISAHQDQRISWSDQRGLAFPRAEWVLSDIAVASIPPSI